MSGWKGSDTDEGLGCILFVIAFALGWYLFFMGGLTTIANQISSGH